MGGDFFVQAFVYLTAAVVSVPVAKRLGLGSVLGYLIAGIVIGPFVMGWVGEEGQDVLHFAEFGVVLMLFLIGLELRPRMLWRMRGPILGLGGSQVALTALSVAAIALAFGQPWQVALAVGFTLALSSTAIVLQTLQEKGLMRSDGGQRSFAVLLFQDIAVIPLLALFPLLATLPLPHAEDGHHADTGFVATLPPWGQTLAVLAAVAIIVIAGRYLMRPVFRFIARARLPEIFTAAALLLVIGIAVLMQTVGLSPALGTFLAGVVLAESEYRHELETNIEPFKGLLLGLFFIAVGASIDFSLIGAQPGVIAGLVGLLMLSKWLVLFVLGRGFGMGLDQNLFFAFALAQGGEFAFVLFSFATQNGVIPAELTSLLIAVVAVSMALTPLLLLVWERAIRPRVGTRTTDPRRPDAVHEVNPVIIAGFDDFGNIVGRLLRANRVGCTVFEHDSDRVETLRQLGIHVFYGDASRLDLLRAAGAEHAQVLVIALDDHEKVLQTVHSVKEHFPHLQILARARGRLQAYDLIEAGVEHVYRETLDSSLRVGIDALRLMGVRAHQATRAAQLFRCYDEDTLRELAAMRGDRPAYIDRARAFVQEIEALFGAEVEETEIVQRDMGWDASTLREEVRAAAAARGER